MARLRSSRPARNPASRSCNGPGPGGRNNASRCIVPGSHSHDNSTPGINSTPASSAAGRASATPAVVSWSVRATAVNPASAASRTTSAGGRVPSEAVEWV